MATYPQLDTLGLLPQNLVTLLLETRQAQTLAEQEDEQHRERDEVHEERDLHPVVHGRILKPGLQHSWRLVETAPPQHRHMDDRNVDEPHDPDHSRLSGPCDRVD